MTRKNESGQALIFAVAVLGIALMGFAGMGIDMGMMRYQKRLLQTAADAAAIAAATDLKTGGITAAATNAVAQNGFTGATSNTGACPTTVAGLTVTVNNPPQSGPHAGTGTSTDYVEVCVAELQPTFFMRILGINNETVSARAVATDVASGGPGGGCLYTLGQPTNSIEGVNVNGSVSINAPSCGIVDNGNFNVKGNAFNVSAASFGVSGCQEGANGKCGNTQGTVTCTATPDSCPTTSMPTSGDPLAYLLSSPPCNTCTVGPDITIGSSGCSSSGGSCSGIASLVNGVWQIQPGTYGSINIGPVKANFTSGNYIIDTNNGAANTGLYFGANATVTGTGTFFYFANQATVGGTGTPTVTLTAPSSGTYAGILFYQAPTDTNTGGTNECTGCSGPTLGGNSGNSYNGVEFFPSDNLTFFGNNNSVNVAIVISDSMTLSGNPTINLDGSSGLPSGVSLVFNALLVE